MASFKNKEHRNKKTAKSKIKTELMETFKEYIGLVNIQPYISSSSFLYSVFCLFALQFSPLAPFPLLPSLPFFPPPPSQKKNTQTRVTLKRRSSPEYNTEKAGRIASVWPLSHTSSYFRTAAPPVYGGAAHFSEWVVFVLPVSSGADGASGTVTAVLMLSDGERGQLPFSHSGLTRNV